MNETGLADLPLDQARQAYKASIIILSVMEEHLHDAPTEVWDVAIMCPLRGLLDYGLWIPPRGLWVMDYGLWMTGSGLWVMDYGL